jgi:hypothetical protein
MVTFELRVAVKLPTRLGGSGAEAAARVVEGLSETTEVSGSTPNAAGNEWRQSRRSKKEGVLITFLFRTHSRGPVSLGERRILCVRKRLEPNSLSVPSGSPGPPGNIDLWASGLLRLRGTGPRPERMNAVTHFREKRGPRKELS